jgi:hypothetical protein
MRWPRLVSSIRSPVEAWARRAMALSYCAADVLVVALEACSVIALSGVREMASSSRSQFGPGFFDHALQRLDLGVDLAELQVENGLARRWSGVLGLDCPPTCVAQGVDAAAQRDDLRGVFGIDRQKLRQFALEVAQLALVVGQDMSSAFAIWPVAS